MSMIANKTEGWGLRGVGGGAGGPWFSFQYLRAPSLVHKDLRSETKGSRIFKVTVSTRYKI